MSNPNTTRLAGLLLAGLLSAPLAGQAATTELVSANALGNPANRNSYQGMPALSVDGRYAVFDSEAANLVDNDLYGLGDVFVFDRWRGQVERDSVNSAEAQALGGNSLAAALSASGRFVVFQSEGTNLASGVGGLYNIFVRDRLRGTTTLVSRADKHLGSAPNGQSYTPTLSPSGRYVVFKSAATNLVPDDTNGKADIFLYDMARRRTTRISLNSSQDQADNETVLPSVSADGKRVVFSSYATNLVPDDTNSRGDVFLRDLRHGTTERVSVSEFGEQANNSSTHPHIAANGRYVAFDSYASNLVMDDSNGFEDVFVRDLKTGANTLASVHSDGTQGNGYSFSPRLSADGRYVVFLSSATNLVDNDTNGTVVDAYLHDRKTGRTRLVSLTDSGEQFTQNIAAVDISPLGDKVSFQTQAANYAGPASKVYVRDLTATSGKGKAELGLDMQADKDNVARGDTLTYTFKVRNNGPHKVDAKLYDVIPDSQLKVTSMSVSRGNCRITAGILVCHLGDLAAGRTRTVTLVTKVIARRPYWPAKSIVNEASVSSALTDGKPGNNTRRVKTGLLIP